MTSSEKSYPKTNTIIFILNYEIRSCIVHILAANSAQHISDKQSLFPDGLTNTENSEV